MINNIDIQDTDIAIIGVSGRFPGSNNVEEFWDNLIKGKETLSRLSTQDMLDDGVPENLIHDKNYINVAGVVPDYDMFDNEFFGYSNRESLLMDPQYRVFLEESWKAFENAGYDPLSTDLTIGVFAGGKPSNYLALYQRESGEVLSTFEWGLYAEASQLATRVSFDLDLKGPSIYVLTACSTSLVVLHTACQSLLNGECDMALAGAISIQSPHKAGYLYKPGLIFSSDGHCRSFDENASGTILSNGVGIVIIKKLSDAIKDGDRIEAVIKGTAINNDGGRKIGFTAPSVDGQAEVIASAINFANIDPETIGYIETHGTGTKIGDLIEIEGLTKAFRYFTDKAGFCKIGSLKSNIGHLDVASGIAGLIKTIFCVKNKVIPATLHFNKLNSNIELDQTPFKINDKLSPWESSDYKRRAGVSSFGFGGTNAHVILESANFESKQHINKNTCLICLSAKNEMSLEQMSINLCKYLQDNKNVCLTDVAYTLQTGRHHFNYRKAITCNSLEELQLGLANKNNIRKAKPYKIAFLFPGQGSQYVNMSRQLYLNYKAFRKYVDECVAILHGITDYDILKIIFVDDSDIKNLEQLKSTKYAQLALFIIEYSLSKFLQSMGIFPSLMLGHSLGEYTAACISGVISLEDTLTIIYNRSILMQSTQNGAMVAVFAEANVVRQEILSTNLSLAAINTQKLCIVSGVMEEIELFKMSCAHTFKCVDLHVSHAFHSATMEPILTDFKNSYCDVQLGLAEIPYISNFTGKIIEVGESLPQDYWSLHLRHTVQFYDGVQSIDNYLDYLFIEVGPGNTLSSLVKQIYPKAFTINLLPSAKTVENTEYGFNESLSEIWSQGINIQFSTLYAGENRDKLSLPSYNFVRNSFWPTRYNKTQQSISAMVDLNPEEMDKKHHNVRDNLYDIWRKHFAIVTFDKNFQDFFGLGGDSLSAVYFIDKINVTFGLNLSVGWVYENSSFDKQCFELENNNVKADTNRMIVFDDKPTGVPIFFIHPSRAGAEVYKSICEALKMNGSIYGINSYFLNSGDYSVNSIESLAKIYITYIKSVKPQGPYFFAGWSMGGIIAYEIANQMMAMGDEILSVYMFDSAASHLSQKSIFVDSIPILQKLLQHDQQFTSLPEHLKSKILKQVEVDNVLLSNYNNYQDYKCPIVLYKAGTPLRIKDSLILTRDEVTIYNNFFSILFDDSSNRWGNYITDLEIIVVDACHTNIIQLPFLNHIVPHMITDLDKKQQKNKIISM
jgi:acyl transferase domain-containing protein/thioesterase domain-containing protein